MSHNNINFSSEKSGFDLKFEVKNNRNIKRSIFEPSQLHSIEETSRTGLCSKISFKLNESKSLLINTKETSFLTGLSKNINNIKSKLSKKLDYSSINNISTNNTNNVSTISMNNKLNIGVPIVKRMSSNKTAFNIKTLLDTHLHKKI